jgi:hypothetical protein
MIFTVTLQMIRELVDPAGQKSDLDVGAAGIIIVQPESTQIDVFTRGHNSGGRKIKDKFLGARDYS